MRGARSGTLAHSRYEGQYIASRQKAKLAAVKLNRPVRVGVGVSQSRQFSTPAQGRGGLMSSTKLVTTVNSTTNRGSTGSGGIPTDALKELGTNPTTSGSNHAPVESCRNVLVPSSRFVVVI